MATPKWVEIAQSLVGLTEVPGPNSNPEIVAMWKDIKRGGIKDDATPWCAAFVGACLERAGVKSSRFESAKSYLDWGDKLDAPVYGAVVVFSRTGGGHVGFVVGLDERDNLLVLGGNQGDAVNVKAFPKSRVTGYRYPKGVERSDEPLQIANAEISRGEA